MHLTIKLFILWWPNFFRKFRCYYDMFFESIILRFSLKNITTWIMKKLKILMFDMILHF
jgi:hypothetical protein